MDSLCVQNTFTLNGDRIDGVHEVGGQTTTSSRYYQGDLLVFVSCFDVAVSLLLLSRPAFIHISSPQWGAADAEIKVLSGGNTKLKCSPFKASYRQVFLPCFFLSPGVILCG